MAEGIGLGLGLSPSPLDLRVLKTSPGEGMCGAWGNGPGERGALVTQLRELKSASARDWDERRKAGPTGSEANEDDQDDTCLQEWQCRRVGRAAPPSLTLRAVLGTAHPRPGQTFGPCVSTASEVPG